jgi:hypothetical protein
MNEDEDGHWMGKLCDHRSIATPPGGGESLARSSWLEHKDIGDMVKRVWSSGSGCKSSWNPLNVT